MNYSTIPLNPWLIVIFITICYWSYRAHRNKKRIAKISRDLSEALRFHGILHIDILASEKLEKYVTTPKLLTSIEKKIEKLKQEKSDKQKSKQT